MGWLLLLIVGGSIVLSGVVAGLAHALFAITDVSFPRLFGDPAHKHDLGLIPTLLLKTGIFSAPTIWATFLMGLGSRAEITLLYGVGIGALLALINVLLVKILIRFKRIGFELLGLIIGLVIGGVLGVIAIAMIGVDVSESMVVKGFVFGGMGIGCIAGVLNGRLLNGIAARNVYHIPVCEIAIGSAVIGSVGSPFMFYVFHKFDGHPDSFDQLVFIIIPLILGCFLGICDLSMQNGAVFPLQQGIGSLFGWLLQWLPIRISQSSFLLKLLILLILIGGIVGGSIGIEKSIEHLFAFPFGWVSILPTNFANTRISSIHPTIHGEYLIGGQTFIIDTCFARAYS